MKGKSVKLFLIITSLLLTTDAWSSPAHHPILSPNSLSNLSPSSARKELTIRQVAPIEFGMFTSGASGGNVTINAKSGTRTVTGDISVLGGNYGRAEFEITGQPAEEVILYFQSGVSLTNKTKGGASIALTKLNTDPAIIRLDQHGRARVGVGATLHAAAHSGYGQYQGFFNVDARYLR